MFKVGEVVFCPMRGSGVVEAIEMRTMLDESREYVIIHMKSPDVMMIPTERVATSGFRRVGSEEAANEMMALLTHKEVDIDHSTDVKQRVKQNQAKLATGSFMECGEVVRDLSCMEQVKTLNNSEKTILLQAKRLLADELAIIKQISEVEATKMIDELLEA